MSAGEKGKDERTYLVRLTDEEYARFIEEFSREPKLDDLPGGWSRNATLVLK